MKSYVDEYIKNEKEKYLNKRNNGYTERAKPVQEAPKETAEQVQDIKPTPQESKLMRFGNGLASFMNSQKKKGSSKPTLNKKVFGKAIESSSIFRGSSGLNLGMGETKEQYKPKSKSPFS